MVLFCMAQLHQCIPVRNTSGLSSLPHQAGDSAYDLTSSPAHLHTSLILPDTAVNKLSNKKAHISSLFSC